MATRTLTVVSKEQDGIVGQNPVSALSIVPWLSGLGSQATAYDEYFGLLKISSSENPSARNEFTATKQPESNLLLGLEKGNTAQFTISPDASKNSGNVQKFQLQNVSSIQTATAEHQKCLELGFSQPVICAKYPYGEQYYGVFSTYGPQLAGRFMLPLNSVTDEGTIFVNAKQYNGIIRRRQYRAKAELENKLLRNRKPYLHLSRHLHAMRRPRGCGGRFLRRDDKNIANGKLSQPTGSQSSEILQSDSGNSNSPRESIGRGSNNLVSEVTSIYSRGDLDLFKINHLCHTNHSLPNLMNAGHGLVLSSKCVAAAISTTGDGCCNLKV